MTKKQILVLLLAIGAVLLLVLAGVLTLGRAPPDTMRPPAPSEQVPQVETQPPAIPPDLLPPAPPPPIPLREVRPHDDDGGPPMPQAQPGGGDASPTGGGRDSATGAGA